MSDLDPTKALRQLERVRGRVSDLGQRLLTTEDRADRLGSVLCAMALRSGQLGHTSWQRLGAPRLDMVEADIILFPSDDDIEASSTQAEP